MSVKSSADVLIGGKIYTLSGYESEEYLQKVANYINNKINEFEEMEQFRRLPADMKSTLLHLNIADDYFKAKEQAELLEQTVREKEKEIYELQHDLISAQIKVKSSEETTKDLEQENKELLLNKARLETSLADALLGKVKGQAAAGHQVKKQEKSLSGQEESSQNHTRQKEQEKGYSRQKENNNQNHTRQGKQEKEYSRQEENNNQNHTRQGKQEKENSKQEENNNQNHTRQGEQEKDFSAQGEREKNSFIHEDKKDHGRVTQNK